MLLPTLIKKELQSHFRSASALAFLACSVLLTHWVFFRTFFLNNQASLSLYFQFAPWVFLLFSSALSMSKWSEEKSSGTQELLLTLPLPKRDLILSKFFSGALVLLFPLLFSTSLALTVLYLGNLDLGQSLASGLGLYLLSLCFLSLGLFCSSLFNSPLVSFLISSLVAFFLFLLGEPIVLGAIPQVGQALAAYLSLQTHYETFLRGLISAKSLLFFLSFITLCLALNALRLDKNQRKVYLVFPLLFFSFTAAYFLKARADFTEDRRFSVSASTRKILSELKENAEIKLYLTQDLPTRLLPIKEDMKNLLAEYQNLSSNRISVQELDPSLDAAEEKKVNALGIMPAQVSLVEKDSRAIKKVYLGMGLSLKGKEEIFPLITDTANLEYELDAALLKLNADQLKPLALIVEKIEDLTNHYSLLKQSLQKNYEVNLISNEQDWEIKENQTLLLLSLQKVSESNLQKLESFLQAGHSAFLLANRLEILPNLEAKASENPFAVFLEKRGLKIEENLVLDESNAPATFAMGGFQMELPYPFWVRVPDESLVFPWTSSLGFLENKPRDLQYEILAHASAEARLQKPPFLLNPQSIPQNESESAPQAPLLVRIQENQSQLFVAGSSRWLEDDFVRMFPDNLVALRNAVDKLMLGNDLISIRAKTLIDRPLRNISEKEKQVLKMINIYGVTALALLFGFYLKRRKFFA